MFKKIGVVVIGKNEGERLKKCLLSIPENINNLVYVDSGSTDESIEFAESNNIASVRLDAHMPFSAARSRNEGFEYLLGCNPKLSYILFLDGDCILHSEWLKDSSEFLDSNPNCAIVTGRLKERFPETSIYNQLCDMEWDAPTGNVRTCGGIFTVRTSAFLSIKGFNTNITAGEEPDLCHRLIGNGWEIHRIEKPMALHDADMTRFSQWWKRAVRSGYGYAQGFMLRKNERQGYGYIQSIKIWLWALFLPAFLMVLPLPFKISIPVLVIIYFAKFLKMAIYTHKSVKDIKQSLLYSFFILIIYFPQLIGQLKFLLRTHVNKRQAHVNLRE